ncbi:hypothetical protein BC940DRAFT_288690 [Gongronella butleri]|nr:hypothetical protein BC940DRAFT_288690 [Gongronella butleri]
MGTALDEHLHSEYQGIVPRFIHELFQRLESKGHDFQVHASFLELYNEEIIDLLNVQESSERRRISSNSSGVHGASFHGTTCDINIREDMQGQIYWTGVREEACATPDDLVGVLTRGSLCRTTGATDMNAVSSRSHAILTVTLKQTVPDDADDNEKVHQHDATRDTTTAPLHPHDDNSNRHDHDHSTMSHTPATSIGTTLPPRKTKVLVSKFHFVDLAGSERLKRTNAQGDRAREGIAINSGLLALGNVISALGDESRRASHVPYRDSKLTRLLQDSLGGNSQTLMVACVSPADANFAETLSTLKYANRARNIKNKVCINQEFAGSSMQVNQLRAQVARLRLELQSVKTSQDMTIPMQLELQRLRQRLKQTSDQLVQASAQRDTLLLERDVAYHVQEEGVGDVPRLWEQLNWLIDHGNDDNASEKGPVMPAVKRILSDQQTIQQLRDELADTQDRLAFLEAAQMMPPPPSRSMTSSWSNHANLMMHAHNSSTTSSNNNNRMLLSHRRLAPTAANKKKRVRFNPSASTRSLKSQPSTQTMVPVVPVASPPQQPPVSLLHIDGYDDIQQWLKQTVGPMDTSSTGTADLRNQVRQSISKARSEIERGLQVLEDAKTEPSANDEYDLLNDDELFERLQSDESNLYLGDLDDWPDGHESSPSSSSSILHASEVSFGAHGRTHSNGADSLASSQATGLDRHPQWSRMVQQIQSDIQVKEELVSQLERSETEYASMRKQFEDKLHVLHSEIMQLKQQRDEINKAPRRPSQQDHQQLRDLKHAYESKLKHLLAQLSDVRRKYAQTTSAIQTSRNQNESMLRALKVHVESLKMEKRRMVKRMKEEAERVKEQMHHHEREIQQLRRKQSRQLESRNRLERETRQLQRLLQKRVDEATVAKQQLKQVIAVVKKAVCEGGMLDDRLLSRCSSFLRVGPIRHASNASSTRRLMPNSSASSNVRHHHALLHLPLATRVSKKKQLLDQALMQHLHGKQILMEMQKLVSKRDSLVKEKVELIAQKEDFQQADDHASTMALDAAVQQCMDERLDTLEAEINYLDARMYHLQQQQWQQMHQQQQQQQQQQEQHAADQQQAMRGEKRVTFADQVTTFSHTTSRMRNGPKKANAAQELAALELQFTVPAGADPDVAHDMALRLIQSSQPDECRNLMQSLVSDMIALQMGEYQRSRHIMQLEKTIDDLQTSLLTMKQAAITTATQHEKKIRGLEHQMLLKDQQKQQQSRRLSTSSTQSSLSHYSSFSIPSSSNISSAAMMQVGSNGSHASSNASSSSAAPPMPPPRRISLVADDEVDSAIDLRGDIDCHHVTTSLQIFDKIYEQGMRAATSDQHLDYHLGACSQQQQQEQQQQQDNERNPPLRPLNSPLTKRRDSMSSPEQFLHQLFQPSSSANVSPTSSSLPFSKNHASPPQQPQPYQLTRSVQHVRRSSLASTDTWASSSTNNNNNNNNLPATSSALIQAHLRRQQDMIRQRSNSQSSTMSASFAPPSPAASLVSSAANTPRKRPSSLILTPLSKFDMIPPHPHAPAPLPSPRASFQHNQRAASAMASSRPKPAANQQCTPPTTPSTIFDRLATSHTQASHAKRSDSALGFHRHSASSLDDLQQRWQAQG